MKKIIFTLLCLILACGLLVGCDKKESDAPSADLKYDIDVTLNGNTLTGKQTVTFINVMKDGLSEAVFHLYPNAYAEEQENKAYSGILPAYGGIEVTDISVGENAVTAQTDDSKQYLSVPLPSPAVGDKVTVKMSYTVTLPECRLRLGKSGNCYLLSSFYPQLAVYEDGNYRRDLFTTVGDPLYSEIGEYDLTFTCPNNLVVASSGKTVSKTDEGETSSYVYHANNVRDFALAASPDFDVLTARECDVDLYYFSIGDAAANERFSLVRSAFNKYTEAFGPSGLETFSVIIAPFDYSGMEFSGLVFVSSSAGDATEETLLHETAHEWWYHLVGNDPIRQSALDEGLTSFTSAYYYLLAGNEQAFSQKIADVKKAYTQYETLQKRRKTGVNLRLDGTIYDYTSYQYTMLMYYKACMLFNNLYELYGKDKTTACLNAYATEYAHKTATFDGFISVCNKELKTDVSGLVNGWLGDVSSIATFSQI